MRDKGLLAATYGVTALALLLYLEDINQGGDAPEPYVALARAAVAGGVMFVAAAVASALGSRLKTTSRRSRQFRQTLFPKNTIQTFSTPSGSPINVTGPGQILTISLSGFPALVQKPFQVMTERVDPVANTISAVTLAGHPLAGWRYWRVYSIGTNDVVIETGAYDSPGPGRVNYVGYYVTIGMIKKAWQQYVQYFQIVLGAAQGNNLRNSLNGMPLVDLSPYNGPLVNGYWDYSGKFTNYILI